jgi:hypothetical protein
MIIVPFKMQNNQIIQNDKGAYRGLDQRQSIANFDPNADFLNNLPTNQTIPSQQELSVVNRLFSSYPDSTKNIFLEFKTDLFLGLLFFILSLPTVDNLLTKHFVITQKYPPYILLLVKSLIFVLLCWLSKNFWLAKK